MPLGTLLRAGRTFGDTHCAEADKGNLGAGEHHEAAEGVASFAIGGQGDIEGGLAGCAERNAGVDQKDLFLGDVGHEYRRVFVGVGGADVACAVPRNGQVFASCRQQHVGQVSRRRIAEGVDVGEVDALGVVVDDGHGGDLLGEQVATGHALGR